MDGALSRPEVLGTPENTAQVIKGISLAPIHLVCCKVHPKLLTEALMEASDAEVVVAKVVGGQMDNEGRVKGVELEGGRVLPCDVAVLCMGPWTGKLSKFHPKMFSIQLNNPQNRDWSGGVCLVLALGGTGPTGEIELAKYVQWRKNHSVTFRLPPEHTIDPTALFLSSCPVKCNDPEVNILNFH